MRISIFLSAAFQFLVLFASVASAAPSSTRLARAVIEECAIDGNPDLYGLGIRIGFYCQLIATCFANTFIPSETRGVQTINLWFQLGLFVSLIFQVTRGGFYAVESYLVVILLSGLFSTTFSYMFICFAIAGGHRKEMFSFAAVITIVVALFLLSGLYIYSAWFWWRGIDRMLVTSCVTYGFFLSKVNMFNWFRTLNKVFNIWMMFAFFVVIISIVVGAVMSYIGGLPILTPRKPTESRILYCLDIILGPFEEPEFSKSGEHLMKMKTKTKAGVLWHGPQPGSTGSSSRRPGITSNYARVQPGMTPADLRKKLNFTKGETLVYYGVGSFIGFGGIVIVMAAVESTLVWNRVNGVSDLGSAGQLIPLVVGVGSLLQVLKNIYLRARENRKKLKKGVLKVPYSNLIELTEGW